MRIGVGRGKSEDPVKDDCNFAKGRLGMFLTACPRKRTNDSAVHRREASREQAPYCARAE